MSTPARISTPVINSNLDASSRGLFPNKEEAARDEKCVVISRIYEEMKTYCNTDITQIQLRKDAEDRYEFLSSKVELKLEEVVRPALVLRQRGVNPKTILSYYSFRLSQANINIMTKYNYSVLPTQLLQRMGQS